MPNPIGNVKGFTTDMVKNMLYVIGLGYMGGSISSMGKSNLFPYELTEPPYKGTLSTGNEEGLLEYLWPMATVGFPYATMNQLGESDSSQYLKWLLETCAYSFAAFRYACSVSAKSGEHIVSKAWGGGLFRFYVVPYFLIYLMTYVHYVMFAIVLVSSGFAADRCGTLYLFSFLTGWFYGLTKCEKLTFGCLIETFIIGIAGVMLFFVNIPWLFIVAFALTMYSYVILLLSPFLWTNGLSKTFQEINKYKRSLVILFMYFTLKSAHQYLTTQVTSGLLIGALYVLYMLFTGKMC